MPGSNLPQNQQTAAPSGLDPDVINLSKAIRDNEAGSNFQARGGSGEFGAYQFTQDFWNAHAPKAGVTVPLEQASPEQQNAVAYHRILALKQQGYNPGQIASIWNSGQPDPSGNVGVNKFGQAYNTPQYVDNVYNSYAQYKNSFRSGMDKDMAEGGQPTYGAAFPYKQGENPLVAGAKAVGNLPTSAYGFAKGIADMVFHPIQTIQNLGGVAIGGLEELTGEADSENTQKYDAFVKALSARYGSLEALTNTAVNDPFGFGADIAGLLSGGAGLLGKSAELSDLASVTARRVTDPVARLGQKIVSPFDTSVELGVEEAAGRIGMTAEELPASARSSSPIVQIGESFAAKGIGGARILDRYENASERLVSIANDTVSKAGGAEDLASAGQALGTGLNKFVTDFKKAVGELYDEFQAKVGDKLARTNRSVDTLNAILDRKEAIGDIEHSSYFANKLARLEGGAEVMEVVPLGAKASKTAKKFPAPTFSVLKQMRTEVGEKLGNAFGDAFVTQNKAQLKQLYGSLTQDMYATMKASRGKKARDLVAAYEKANATYKAGRDIIQSAMVKQILRFAKNRQWDKILPALLRPSASITDIQNVMKLTGASGTAQIRTSLLQKIFDAATNKNGAFTPGGINKQLIKYGDKYKSILAPEQYQALEDIGKVANALGKVSKIAEGSQTAFLMHQYATLGLGGWAAIDLLTGNIAGAAGKLALVLGDYGASKFISSDVGQKLLTHGLKNQAKAQATLAEINRNGQFPPELPGAARTEEASGAAKTATKKAPTGGDEALKSALASQFERVKAKTGLDFNVEDVAMTGSRSAGKGTKKSDMDVAVQISGTADEAAVLAALRSGKVKVDGAKVDFNVTKEPLDQYRAKTENPNKYGDGKLTSEFVPDTKIGRLKEAFKNYLKNIRPGLSTMDVTEGGQRFDIGLTSVKGAIPSAYDDLVAAADDLRAAGKFDEAQKKYNEALAGGIETLTKSFEGTGIKVKPRGVGFGVYGGLEPNYDAVAIVPKGKEDLFHYVLADVADRDFHQHSMLTYRQAAPGTDLGIVDANKGISNEPHLRFNLDKAVTAETISALEKAAKEADLAGFSVRDGGKSIDIINLSAYDKNYEGFTKKIDKFLESAKAQGISGQPELRVAETRFIGGNPESGHGLASYKQVRGAFRAENPDFFGEEGFTSKIIDRIKNRGSVSRSEIEQMTKMQDVTPMERSAVLSVLDEAKDMKKFPVKDLAVRIKEKSLPVTAYETDSYATYGLDNVDLSHQPAYEAWAPKIREARAKFAKENDLEGTGAWSTEFEEKFAPIAAKIRADAEKEVGGWTGARTLVFETPIEHGSSGHFSNPKHFGHTRVFIDVEDGKRIGYITEMQSDVAQKSDLNIGRNLSEMTAARKEAVSPVRERYDQVMRERDEVAQRGHNIKSDSPESKAWRDEYDSYYKKLNDLTDEMNRVGDAAEKKYLEAHPPTADQKQLISLLKDRNKYQDVMLRGTLQWMEKQGVQEVRIATPSSAAKIEGFSGGEDMVPYSIPGVNRITPDTPDLDVGDRIEYIRGDEIVLEADNYSITVASQDNVKSFDFDQYMQEEIDSRWEDDVYSMKSAIYDTTAPGATGKAPDLKPNMKITEEMAQKIKEHGVSYQLEKLLDKIDDENNSMTVANLEEDFRDKYWYDTDPKENLIDAYGKDKVFFKERSVGSHGQTRTETVYVLDDKADTETLQQPSQYEGIHPDTLAEIDEDPSLIGEHFSDTQATVLENYSDLRKGALRRLEKTENIKVKLDTDENGHAWYMFPMTKVKKYLFGA